MNERKAAKPHYKKLQLIKDLFKEDQKQFLSLPSRPFDVCRYDWFKADGYGKVCIDGKHYYSTKPELHNQKVLIGIRAHYIDVLEENGQLIVRHRRQYGDVRTDVSDYSTTLSNSGIRKELPDPLRDYLDGLEKPELKEKLRLMSGLNDEYGYRAAVDAMTMSLKNGDVNSSDATIIAQRITGYGIDTPPESGPSLEVYDRAFLGPGREDEAS